MDSLVVDLYPMGDREAFLLEYDVYLREGYIPPNAFHRVLENDYYPEFVHFVARHREKAIGSLRLVTDPTPRHGIFKLNSFAHFPLFGWTKELLEDVESSRIFEIGTMVIQPEFRGGAAYNLLFQKAFEFAVLRRVKYSLATIDEQFFHRLCKRGLPFRAIGEKRYYMGSETVPAMIDVEQLARMFLGTAHMKPAESPARERAAMAS